MEETIYSRAVMSAFQDQLEKGVIKPNAQLKVVERRMRQLPSEEDSSFSQLVALLVQGILVKYDGQNYVAQVNKLQTEPSGGLTKRLSRTVDKKTRNPKTSKGTVWRRNSVVKERRRPLPSWRSSQIAQLAAKRKSEVQLMPFKDWTAEQEAQDSLEREQKVNLVIRKQIKRNRKRTLIEEYERRMQLEKTDSEQLADGVMEFLYEIAEKRGIANEPELYQRVLCSIENNQPLPLLFVWGPPYEGQALDQDIFTTATPEAKMADEIEVVITDIRSLGLEVQSILLFADIYGTEINGLSQQEVTAYYQSLQIRFQNTSQITTWSDVIAENQQRYAQIEQQVLPNLQASNKIAQNAQIIQAKLGTIVTGREATRLGEKYVKERIIEGTLLNEGFVLNGRQIRNVVKLGTAPTRFRNDEPYEVDLPRIYVKNMTRAAWNTAR